MFDIEESFDESKKRVNRLIFSESPHLMPNTML